MKVIGNIAAATILLFSSLAVAQTEVPTFEIGNLQLEDTTLEVGQYVEAKAGCGPSCPDAGAFTPLVAPIEVTCPVKAGEICTFAVHVDAATRSGDGTEAAFQYVGDAQTTVIAPLPNIPPSTGFYMWTLVGTGDQVVSASTTFVALVKNTKENQKHHVEIDFGCFSSGGQGGCFVQVLGLFQQLPHSGSPAAVTIQVFRERKREHKDID
jgi:hypothetical protein